ncbi:hypothetical protein FVEN_g12833 [Fusarium venenatum]|nr:hypothetical protein FVEN_g12833 [Fusarium venenatum]
MTLTKFEAKPEVKPKSCAVKNHGSRAQTSINTGIAYTTSDTNASTASLQEQIRKNSIATTGHPTKTGRKRTTFLNKAGTAKVAGSILRGRIIFLAILNGIPYAVKS